MLENLVIICNNFTK